MSQVKHGPKPWHIEGPNIISADGCIVATVPRGLSNFYPAIETRHANADVIVKSPDMRLVLQEVFDLLEEHEPPWYLMGHYKRLRAAGCVDNSEGAMTDNPRKTNELMTGLLCECGHDYACHAPAPHFHCGECDCKRSRVQIADHGGEVIAELLGLLKAYLDDHDYQLGGSKCDCGLCERARPVLAPPLARVRRSRAWGQSKQRRER